MTMQQAFRIIAALTTIGALTSSQSFAQSTEDGRRLDEIARTAAQQFAAARAAEADQTRPTVPPPPPGTVVELTLDSATERALERNLDIAVERLNPQTYDFSLAALDANYRPTLTSNFSMRSQTAFARSQTAGGDVLVTDTLTNNYGVVAEPEVGRRQLRGGVQQQPAGAVRRLRDQEPGAEHQPHGSVRAAAAAELPHRRHPRRSCRSRSSIS